MKTRDTAPPFASSSLLPEPAPEQYVLRRAKQRERQPGDLPPLRPSAAQPRIKPVRAEKQPHHPSMITITAPRTARRWPDGTNVLLAREPIIDISQSRPPPRTSPRTSPASSRAIRRGAGSRTPVPEFPVARFGFPSNAAEMHGFPPNLRFIRRRASVH
ncbi:hypothetical protein VTO73DRAFT_8437 [Trametes versicolor]